MATRKSVPILLAEDDPDDQLLLRRAFAAAGLTPDLRFVNDGEELLDYLNQRAGHSEASSPRPGLILLDLNMPRKNGREALREIRADPKIKHIPVIVLTTSKREEDILQSYAMGASSYIVKPVVFSDLVEVIKTFETYWLQVVELPPSVGQVNRLFW
jgi:CheY-like chemotaxis protein